MSRPLDHPLTNASAGSCAESSDTAESESSYDRLHAAGEDIVALLLETYSDGHGRVYGETAIAAAAALTGEFALRSTGLPLPEGGAAVVGGVHDGILFADPTRSTAWSMITRAAGVADVSPQELPDLSTIVISTLGAIGKPSFPPLTVPHRHFPREHALNPGPRLRGKVQAISDRQRLSRSDLVVVLGWAVGALIIRMRMSLPAAIMVRLAAEVMIAVSRVGPLDEPVADLTRSHLGEAVQ